jgi:hypothetical protein
MGCAQRIKHPRKLDRIACRDCAADTLAGDGGSISYLGNPFMPGLAAHVLYKVTVARAIYADIILAL